MIVKNYVVPFPSVSSFNQNLPLVPSEGCALLTFKPVWWGFEGDGAGLSLSPALGSASGVGETAAVNQAPGQVGLERSECCRRDNMLPILNKTTNDGVFAACKSGHLDCLRFLANHKASLQFGECVYFDEICCFTMSFECYVLGLYHSCGDLRSWFQAKIWAVFIYKEVYLFNCLIFFQISNTAHRVEHFPPW